MPQAARSASAFRRRAAKKEMGMTAGSLSAADRRRAVFAAWEPRLGAIVALDDGAFATLDAARGPLAGLAVGVKDVVDVAGFPTRNGSAACADAAPAFRDAPTVAALRAAGAAILCKTATTEFAFTDPTPTLNPHDPAATPGGSSSGSGAAVAAGLLDLAIGTQTAGSLCRPAAYCGAVAFKPSLGALSTEGMTPLAPAFDTIGFIASSVDVAAAAWRACGGSVSAPGPLFGRRIARAAIDPSAPMTDAAIAALADAARALGAAGAEIEPATAAIDLEAVVSAHRTVMLAEAAARHGALLRDHADRLRPNFHAALEAGSAIASAEEGAARARLAAAKTQFWEAAAPFDALLAPPTPGPAPHRDGGTGFQHLLTPWTVFGGPLVCLPWGADRDGRPLSVMLAARPGQDGALLALAASLEAVAPPRPVPAPPAALSPA
jgi:Asp-tRNA(Asn)/Glu-tRNA(Gln) amidotransferase A subunit family amidase